MKIHLLIFAVLVMVALAAPPSAVSTAMPTDVFAAPSSAISTAITTGDLAASPSASSMAVTTDDFIDVFTEPPSANSTAMPTDVFRDPPWETPTVNYTEFPAAPTNEPTNIPAQGTIGLAVRINWDYYKSNIGSWKGGDLYHVIWKGVECAINAPNKKCYIPTKYVADGPRGYLRDGLLGVEDLYPASGGAKYTSMALRNLMIGTIAAAVQAMPEADKQNCFDKKLFPVWKGKVHHCNIANWIGVELNEKNHIYVAFDFKTTMGGFSCKASKPLAEAAIQPLLEEYSREAGAQVTTNMQCGW